MGCIVGKNVAPSNERGERPANKDEKLVKNHLFRGNSIKVQPVQKNDSDSKQGDDESNDNTGAHSKSEPIAGTSEKLDDNEPEENRDDSGYSKSNGAKEKRRNSGFSGDRKSSGFNDTRKRHSGFNDDSGYGKSNNGRGSRINNHGNGDGEESPGIRNEEDQRDGQEPQRVNSVEETPIEPIGNHIGHNNITGHSSNEFHDETIPSLDLPLHESTPRVVENHAGRQRRRISPRKALRRKSRILGCMPSCSSVVRPNKRSKITGCTYLSNGYLVIVDNRNQQVKLYNTELKCCSFVEFDDRPFDVCEVDGNIYLTIPQARLIQKLTITFPMLFVRRKLIKRSTFPTEGQCRAIVGYKMNLIVSVFFKTHVNTTVSDTAWQIQIIATNGEIKRRISHDPDGLALFYDAKYLALMPNKKEIVISEGEDNRVKCLDIESGELTFNHHMEDPKGVVCDKSGNIYVLGNHGTIRWILADREYVKVLLKGTKSINYSECITYWKEKNTLAVPRNENKIELYKLRNSIHFDPSEV